MIERGIKMSRIGNRIITIPAGVTVAVQQNLVNVTGPKGSLSIPFDPKIVKVEQKEQTVEVKRLNELKTSRMLHGTINSHISNAIIGVTKEFKKDLVLKGVGYRAKTEGSNLLLTLGFSHPVKLPIPKNIKVETPAPTDMVITSVDKQALGEFCAVIRSYRMPEPYKGKGVLFKDEQIIRKVGKKADK